MIITYHGHACFSITSNNYTIVLDPYKDVSGFKDICLQANEVICSHSHLDHAYVDGVIITKKESPFVISKIDSFHDDCLGQKRGNNTITVLTVENKKIVHLGDLGHLLSQEVIEKLKDTDVLMIPVGGFYTIGINEALQIIKDINPKYIIPMHYRDKDKGLSVLESIDEFVSKANNYLDRLLLVKAYDQNIEL